GGVLRLQWAGLANLSARMIHLAKLIISSRAPSYAPSSIYNDYWTLRRFDTWIQRPGFEWSDITPELGRAWLRYGLSESGSAGNDFARLRSFYQYGTTALQHSDFSRDVLLRLKSI